MGGKQLSFADALSDPRLGANRRLEAIGAAIDWAPLAALSARLRPERTGRPPYEPLVMLKALLLQRLYALSDPQLEEALFDRLSFPRFFGVSACWGPARRADAVPRPPGGGRERRSRSLPRRGQPAGCRQGPDPQDRHADRRHDHRRQEPQARARRRPWGASSFRARRRLDEEERPLPFRLSPHAGVDEGSG